MLNRMNLCGLVACAGLASVAAAEPVSFVLENSGNSYTFGDGLFVSLVGARDVTTGVELFAMDIMDMARSGGSNIQGLYNGIAPGVSYSNGDADPSNGIEAFVSALFNLDGRHVGVFYVVHSGTVVFDNNRGGTLTLGTNGNLGQFDGTFGVTIIPLPPAAFAGLGMLGVIGGVSAVKRRRAG
ncbi:MAG: hypothetical protein LAT64_01845 [Phycisphaerales bacterium]|nr:hypothetical protein [Planctomycetota bacterium]MCH8507503.1 hypothetical protein [Phycisphaerales bacterium]